jgi:alpha-1,2-mannosyltransferase
MRVKGSMPVWAFGAAGVLAVLVPLLIRGRGGLWPPATPAQPAGVDLAMMLDYARAWLDTGNPFAGLNPYPPLAAVAFAPLAGWPFAVAYGFVAALTLAAFVSVAAILPLLAFPQADRAAVGLAALAGTLSYGLWFELRWGQFNVLALAGAAWGLFLFHRGRGRGARIAAYALFSAGIQLKLYPAIFVFLFARDARAWKENLARWAGLGAANVALLFALGPRTFADFLHSVRAQAAAPYVWAGNHSLQSFAEWAGRPEWTAALFALFALCFAIALARAARNGGRGAFAELALTSALGAMLLPGVSHDYKLVAFPLAFGTFVAAAHPVPVRNRRGWLAAGLFLGLCGLEAWTLVSPAAKPAGAQNNAPFLLAACGLLALGAGSTGEARIRSSTQ